MPIPIFVQEKDSSNGGVGNTVSFTFASPNTRGNFIVIGAFDDGNVPAVTDTALNIYHLAVNDTTGIQIFYAWNINPSASNTVTLNWGADSNFFNACGIEYSGVMYTGSPLDGSSHTASSSPGTSLVTGTINTLFFEELAIACFNGGSSGISFNTPFVQRYNFNSGQVVVGEFIQQLPGPISASGTTTISQNWHAAIVSFKADYIVKPT